MCRGMPLHIYEGGAIELPTPPLDGLKMLAENIIKDINVRMAERLKAPDSIGLT